MAKKVEGYIKLQIQAGKATPAPPVGPALGQHGVTSLISQSSSMQRLQTRVIILSPVLSPFTQTEVSHSSSRSLLQLHLLRRHARSRKHPEFPISRRLQSFQRLISKRSQRERCLTLTQLLLKQQ